MNARFRIALAAMAALAASGTFAQEPAARPLAPAASPAVASPAAPAPATDAPVGAEAAAPAEPKRPVRRALPPEAFTTPTNYVLVVNHKGAVDAAWLGEHCAFMQKQLQAAVKMDDADGEIGADPRAFVQAVRVRHGENAKIVIVVSKEPGLAPVLASPYEYWTVMDAAWVEKAGGDAAQRNDRMGKRIYQALGHCVGAGYRIEREAVMRYTPEPKGMDDCLSHGFHPLNSQIFDTVRRGIGLDGVRLRPRQELVELGILQPLPAKTPANTEKTEGL